MQNESIVVKQFDHQIDLYTKEGTGAQSAIVQILQAHLGKKSQSKFRICEYGGGDGSTLASLAKALPQKKFNLTNIELVDSFGKHQASSDINFECGSILDTQSVPDNSFDVVFTRNVLHHLIAGTLNGCRKNQRAALANMLRVIKPGGLIIIEEQTNQLFWARFIIFYASRLATILKINIPELQITPYTNVGYLSQIELAGMAGSLPSTDGIIVKYRQWKFPWWMKYPLLLLNSGASYVLIKKK